jgi:hypothetical protein
MPDDIALRAALVAVNCAAKGVPFLVPLNPELPADAHEITLPFISVILTMVLLNDDFM